jgi:hypothetical protein
VTIEYSTNSGLNWQEINGGTYSKNDDGSETWILPSLDSLYCLIRINATDRVGLKGSDSSDTTFIIYITLPTATITSPAVGAVLRAGSPRTIQWLSSGGVGIRTVTIEFSTDNGQIWQEINAGSYSHSNDGSESWTNVPDLDSDQCLIKINITDQAAHTTPNYSSLFYIDKSSPTCSIIEPEVGDLFGSGSFQSIIWSAKDMTNITIDIEFTVNNGLNWFEINGGNYSPLNDNTELWRIPANDSTLCRIRITATDQAGHSSTPIISDQFTIDAIPPSTPPVLSWIEGTTSTSTTLNLNWSAGIDIHGIAGYYIQVAVGKPDFENCSLLERFVVGVTSIKITATDGVKDGNTYYFRVRSKDNAGLNSTWSMSSAGVSIKIPSIFNKSSIYIILAIAAVAAVAVTSLVIRSRKKSAGTSMPVQPKWTIGMRVTFPKDMSLQNKLETIISQNAALESIDDPEINKLLESPAGYISADLIGQLRKLAIPPVELRQILAELPNLSPEELNEFLRNLSKI